MNSKQQAVILWAAAAALLTLRPAGAVIQGSESAEVYAVRAESQGQHRQAVVWRRAAVDLLERLSVPMFDEIRRQRAHLNDPEADAAAENLYQAQVVEPLKRNRAALRTALQLGARQSVSAAELARLEKQAEDLTLRWMLAYPDRFFRFGLYRQVQEEVAHQVALGNWKSAVEREADAREICARQYRHVLVRYLADLANRGRRSGEKDTASRYETLAKHYSRLAASQEAEARMIRENRQMIGAFLANPGMSTTGKGDGVLRRLAALRLSVLTRFGEAEEALQNPDPRFRLRVVRYLAGIRSAGGLLTAETDSDPAVRTTATLALEGGVDRGDVVLLRHLVSLADRNSGGGSTDRIHELLSRYRGESRTFSKARTLDRDQEMARYWGDWWRSSLRPGIAATYYQDGGCFREIGAEDLDGSAPRPQAVPAGARGVRWETVLEVQGGEIFLLSVRRGGAAKVRLDGVPVALTADGRSDVQVARLALTEGQHVLRVDYAPNAGETLDPAVRVLPVTAGSPGAVRFYRHDLPPPAPAQARASFGWIGALLAALAFGALAFRCRRLSD